MPIPRQISDYLDSQHVWYRTSKHPLAFTAQGLAHVQHVSGKLLAKAVMIKADNRMVMAVLPASHRIEFGEFQQLLHAGSIRLASEEEFKDLFPDCELGALPPLGNLYHIEVWIDRALHEHPSILFTAGTHIETIEMSYADFERLVQPRVGTFSSLRH
jgi:Ala-tRNA(Pro) deacylase